MFVSLRKPKPVLGLGRVGDRRRPSAEARTDSTLTAKQEHVLPKSREHSFFFFLRCVAPSLSQEKRLAPVAFSPGSAVCALVPTARRVAGRHCIAGGCCDSSVAQAAQVCLYLRQLTTIACLQRRQSRQSLRFFFFLWREWPGRPTYGQLTAETCPRRRLHGAP